MAPPGQSPSVGRAVLLALLTLLLFASPFAHWWAAQRPPWYLPFVLWLGIIVLTAMLVGRPGRHDV